jgi:hypothetical protein
LNLLTDILSVLANDCPELEKFFLPAFHDYVLDIAHDPVICQEDSLKSELPKATLSGLLSSSFNIATDTIRNIRHNAISLISSLQFFFPALARHTLDTGLLSILNSMLDEVGGTTRPETVQLIIGLLFNILSLKDMCFIVDELIPCIDLLSRLLFINGDPSPLVIFSVAQAISQSPGIADVVLNKSPFEQVPKWLDSVNRELVLSLIEFIHVFLTSGSRESREKMRGLVDWDLWKLVLDQEDEEILMSAVAATRDIVDNNWEFSRMFHEVGIISAVLKATRDGSFSLRKTALSLFLDFADRLPCDVLEDLVGEGLVENLTMIAEEMNSEDCVKILDLLKVLLETSVSLPLVHEVYQSVKSVGLERVISAMMDDDDERVMIRAIEFNERFLCVETQVCEIGEIGGCWEGKM